MLIKGEQIIVTSNEPWGDIWFSKQNYAYELSRNNTVFFINPPTGKWNPRNLFSSRFRISSYTSSLFYIDYVNYIPIRFAILNLLNNWLVSKKLLKFLRKRNFKPTIIWAFDPMRFYKPQYLQVRLSIYHCVDYYYLKYLGEVELCKNSNLIFATSKYFLEEFKDFSTPKHIVPHGISEDEFILLERESKELNIPFEKYALYIGVIDRRMDFEMYELVVRKFPDINFVFVGPVRPPDNESASRIFVQRIYPNVILTGPIHFKKLKYYVEKSWFCMSFMDMNFHPNTVHHHKTLVYLSQGKPIFSYAFKAYKSDSEIMYQTNDKEKIISQMVQFITFGESEDLKDKRINYAKQYQFANLLERAGDIILRQEQ